MAKFGGIGHGGVLVIAQLASEVDDAVPRAGPQPVAASIDQDAPEPGVEPAGIPQAVEASPGSHGGVVDGVLGFDPVSEDHGGEPVGAVELTVDELAEGSGPTVDEPQRRSPSLRHRLSHQTPQHRSASVHPT